jgi:uncharacterized protein
VNAASLKARLRTDLKNAMREKRTDEVALLRNLIAALDNAEAVPTHGYRPRPPGDSQGEVARRELGGAEVDSLLAREIAEREVAAEEFERHGRSGEASRLMQEAEAIARYRAG